MSSPGGSQSTLSRNTLRPPLQPRLDRDDGEGGAGKGLGDDSVEGASCLRGAPPPAGMAEHEDPKLSESPEAGWTPFASSPPVPKSRLRVSRPTESPGTPEPLAPGASGVDRRTGPPSPRDTLLSALKGIGRRIGVPPPGRRAAPAGLPPLDDVEAAVDAAGAEATEYLSQSPSDLDLCTFFAQDTLGTQLESERPSPTQAGYLEQLRDPRGPSAYVGAGMRDVVVANAHRPDGQPIGQDPQATYPGTQHVYSPSVMLEAGVQNLGGVPLRTATAPVSDLGYYGIIDEQISKPGLQVGCQFAAHHGNYDPRPPQGQLMLRTAQTYARSGYARSVSMPHQTARATLKSEPKRGSPSTAKVPAAKNAKAKSTSSRFRGVTQHRRTGRWEAHVWVEGKQVYLGGFDDEERAGRAYDLVAIRCRGSRAVINFDIEEYAGVIPELTRMQMSELVQLLRRRSKGFSRGRSQCRGVTKHKCGKWEARLGNKGGRKYQYLGLFEKESDAARAHDRAAVLSNGVAAMTNYDISNYAAELHVHWRDNHVSGEDPGAPESSFWAAYDALHRGLSGCGHAPLS